MKRFSDVANFPDTGSLTEIYLAEDSNILYVWDNANGYVVANIGGNAATATSATTAGSATTAATAAALNGTATLTAAAITSAGVGDAPGATTTVVEQGDGVFHKSIITLTSTPITLTDDAGVGQYGAVDVYNFPAGNVHILGAVLDADLTLAETWWANTAAGDVGIGTVAAASGDALATTEQNIVPTTAIAALVAQVGPITGQSTGVLITGAAGGADAVARLNIRIADDAAHMPDLVTNGAFTGDATGWTLGAGWAYGTNNVAATLSDAAMTQTPASPTILAGVSYILAFDVTASAGSVRASVGGTNGTVRSTSATFTETIVAGADGVLSFTGTGFTGTIDNVTLTPLTGTGTISGTATLVWTNLGDIA